MKPILLNGSPRGKGSNSAIMLRWIAEGYGEELDIHNIGNSKDFSKTIDALLKVDEIILALPLYVDSMPAQVMCFFETIASHREKLKEKKITTIIHSGFIESMHSFVCRKNLQLIYKELGLIEGEFIIRGGSEATRHMPESWQKGVRKKFNAIGIAVKEKKSTPTHIIESLLSPITLSSFGKIVHKFLAKTTLSSTFWKSQLRKHGATKISFAKPYQK